MSKITFSLPYNTRYGQELYICGSIDQLGDNDPTNARKMTYSNGVWSTSILSRKGAIINYFYLIVENGKISFEAGDQRNLIVNEKCDHTIYDEWKERDYISSFLTSPFKNALFYKKRTSTIENDIVITVYSPPLSDKSKLYISGNCNSIGNWNPDKSTEMLPVENNKWSIGFEKNDLPKSLEYKFIVKTTNDNDTEIVEWETGPNRKIDLPQNDSNFKTITNHQYLRITPNKIRLAGTAIPVFSMRSHDGFGIGEFNDIKLVSEYLNKTGQNILQILPVNDTTTEHNWRDSYPYDLISVRALNPIYLNLQLTGRVKDREFRERHNKKREKLNSLNQIDYNAVERGKWLYIKQIYKKEGPKLLKSKLFREFFKTNSDWLVPYAAFCFLRDKYKTADFRTWPEYSKFNKIEIEKLSSEESKSYNDIAIHYFVQYHLHKQLLDAKRYANSLRVIVKGDLAVGVSRNSVEIWQNPSLFNDDVSAGAPPDSFSANGQNWGFPTYNWDNMQKEGYLWWRDRIKHMSRYFDTFRIDHILGYFRIWEIPVDSLNPLDGYFNPSIPYSKKEIEKLGFESTGSSLFVRHKSDPEKLSPAIKGKETSEYINSNPDIKELFDKLYQDFYYNRNELLWRNNAIANLQPVINSSDMLACGEDLGMIPSSVSEIMHKLRILSLKVERMSESPQKKFNELSSYPYFSVCTTSTHDTSNLREWWEEDIDRSSEYYRYLLGLQSEAPTTCEPWLCKIILEKHLLAPSMFSIIPIQDWFSLIPEYRANHPKDERINNPSNPDNYWRFRIKPYIEDLLDDTDYQKQIKELIKASGRLL
jgi:4-alpha-glucanotransferase